jgi:phosphoenolpyruvate carboxylase
MSFTQQFQNNHLTSIDQREVATGLSDIFIDSIKDGLVKDKLEAIRNIIWRKDEPGRVSASLDAETARRNKDKFEIKDIIDSVPQEKRSELAQAYVRLGHLYEIAGHAARENFFHKREEKLAKFHEQHPDAVPPKELMTPGGVHELLYHDPFFKGMSDVGKVVDALSEPVSEYVFTQHPTNTNTLDSMKLQRQIADALDKATHLKDAGAQNAAMEKLKESIAQFGDSNAHPIVQDQNFTVADETNIVINFLSNAFTDIDRLYEVAERGLSRRFKEGYNEDMRWKLDLKQRFSSWGSAGDKDGNVNIKSENTLEAIVLHKRQAADLYAKALENVPSMGAWREKFVRAEKEYGALVDEMEAKRKSSKDGNDISLDSDEFAKLSKRAKDIAQELQLDSKQFLSELEQAKGSVGEEERNKLLSVSRKVKIFGFSLGKIEYRETAEEYERVFDVLMQSEVAKAALPSVAKVLAKKPGKNADEEDIKEYNDLRAEMINDMLNDENARSKWVEISQAFLETADPLELRKYKNELTKEEKDLLKEYKELVKLVSDIEKNGGTDDHKAAHEKRLAELKEKMPTIEQHQSELDTLNDRTIVYHTLRRMELARDFDDMTTHNVLAECKGTHNLLEALALQVAVTDRDGKRAMMNIVPLFEDASTMKNIPNVLKEGLEGPGTNEKNAYKEHLEELQKRDGTKKITQQIQIAHSDNARRAGAIASRGIIHGGHYAAREAIDAYNKAHPEQPVELQFFEGGSQSDSYRNGVRAVTAVIKDFGLGDFAKMTFQGGDLLNYFNEPTSTERLMLRSIVEQAKMSHADAPKNGVRHALEDAVVATIEDLQHQYDQDYYDKPSNPIGKILHALGYREQTAAGSAGTRGQRGVMDHALEIITGVIATAVRTIGFSEAFQHGGLHPSCLGTKSLENDLSKRLFANEAARRELEFGFSKAQAENGEDGTKRAFDTQGQLTAEGLQYLYKASPTFCDAIDKMTYSLINTRVTPLANKLETYQRSLATTRDKTLDDAFGDVMREYSEAGTLVYKTRTGKEVTPEQGRLITHDNNETLQLDRTINLLKSVDKLRHFEPLSYKHRFVDGLDMIEEAAGMKNSRLMHNGRDTLYHGRTFMADDPNYRNGYMDEVGKKVGLA